MFPVINDIEQVREAIRGRPEFIEANKGDYIVFNYMVAHEDSFDCPIRRECRGLIFSKDGEILARRFHKFFNLGEKKETHPDIIDFKVPHIIEHKLDGSMISPILLNGELRWTTKMGITDIALDVEKFIHNNGSYRWDYHDFAVKCCRMSVTPIFEFTSPTNRIVLEYKEPSLILTAMRDNFTGDYWTTPNEFTDLYGIPTVPPFIGELSTLKEQIGMEGVVLKFNTGLFVKVKTDWYCAIHKAKDQLLLEKNVIRLILEDKLDDILPNLLKEDRDRLENFRIDLLMKVDKISEIVQTNLKFYCCNGLSRKYFALNDATSKHPFIRALMFSCWDRWDDISTIRTTVINQILKHTSSQVDIDSIRGILGVKWNPTS